MPQRNSDERKKMLEFRRVVQRVRESTFFWPITKNSSKDYQKSIWPEGKKAKAGRMG